MRGPLAMMRGKPAAGGSGGLENVSNKGSVTAAATYTFTDCSLGEPAANRVILIAVSFRGYSSRQPAAITVDGISAVHIIRVKNGTLGSQIWYAEVPDGSSATIVVSCAGMTLYDIQISVYRTTGSLSVVDTASGSASNPATLDVNTMPGDIVVAVAYVYPSTAETTVTWTGVTNDYQLLAQTQIYSFSSAIAETEETPRAVSFIESPRTTLSYSSASVRLS